MLQVFIVALIATFQPTSFTIVMPVSPETQAGQRLIGLQAVKLCKGRYPQLGRYTFKGEARVGAAAPVAGRFIYRGEVTCLDRAPEPPQGVPVPADWSPSAEDQQRARAATMAYFAAVDRGDVAALEAMMTPGHRATSTREARAEGLSEFRKEAGPPGVHRIIRTTWYANPPGVEPGAYVAVDFDRRYQQLSASCGYVAWHRQADGRLLLVRDESGNAPLAAGETPEKLAEARRLLRCRD